MPYRLNKQCSNHVVLLLPCDFYACLIAILSEYFHPWLFFPTQLTRCLPSSQMITVSHLVHYMIDRE